MISMGGEETQGEVYCQKPQRMTQVVKVVSGNVFIVNNVDYEFN